MRKQVNFLIALVSATGAMAQASPVADEDLATTRAQFDTLYKQLPPAMDDAIAKLDAVPAKSSGPEWAAAKIAVARENAILLSLATMLRDAAGQARANTRPGAVDNPYLEESLRESRLFVPMAQREMVLAHLVIAKRPSPDQGRPSRLPGGGTVTFNPADYPPFAIRMNHEGTTYFRLAIGSQGRATSCAVTTSSGYPSMALAIELAEYIGQREGDMLKLQASQYREVMNLDPELRRALAGPDGRVMGLDLRQGKTKRWVGVPVAGEMRERIEAAIAANAKREVASTNILVSDHVGRPWTKRPFIAKFTEIKQRAMAPRPEDLTAGFVPHPGLAELQFRDLRRTCVVRLGELGLEDALIAAITGHKLASVKRILEVYMPRTTKMAARAVVARIGHRVDVEQREKRA